MGFDLYGMIEKLCVYAIPLVFALTVHEYAHGLVAKWFGDKTAENAGRLTLNPVPHIDLVGTLILPIGMLVLGIPLIFGWAKPVPINPSRFRNYKAGIRWVSAAGVISNFLMMVFWAIIFMIGIYMTNPKFVTLAAYLKDMSQFGILINAMLGIFNLIPIPPLDGSRIVDSFLSPKASQKYNSIEPYGTYIILLVLLLGGFKLLSPIIFGLSNGILLLLQYIINLFI